MKESKLYSFLRPILTIFTKVCYKPRYIGLENLKKEGKVIYAGNHTHILDCLLLISATKRNIHFLAKKELWHGIKKIIFAHMGLIPVNRKARDHEAIIMAEKYLNNDQVIGIFPEGTTEKGRGLLPFKKGAVKMAYDTKSEIVPFAIIGKYRLFRKEIIIIFGKPYQVKNKDLDKENELLEERIKKLIKRGYKI